MIIWSVKCSLHKSNNSPELLQSFRYLLLIVKFSIQFKSLPFFSAFFSLLYIPSKHSSWWRRLENVLKTSFVFVFKTSTISLDQDQYIRLGHTSLRRLQDVFKTSSRHLAKTSSRRLQKVFKAIAKTSSRHLQDILQGCLQDVLKMYHQVKLFA